MISTICHNKSTPQSISRERETVHKCRPTEVCLQSPRVRGGCDVINMETFVTRGLRPPGHSGHNIHNVCDVWCECSGQILQRRQTQDPGQQQTLAPAPAPVSLGTSEVTKPLTVDWAGPRRSQTGERRHRPGGSGQQSVWGRHPGHCCVLTSDDTVMITSDQW